MEHYISCRHWKGADCAAATSLGIIMNNLEKFVKAKIPDQISSTGSLLPSAITNQRRLPSAITTQKHSTGEKTLAVGNDHKFKPGQRVVIGVPPNTERRTIIKA